MCMQGRSRSTTAVIAYLMAWHGVEFQEALRIVREKRKIANPNVTFAELLKTFGKSATLRELRERLTRTRREVAPRKKAITV